MDILYIDNHVLALNKPAGLLTQATELNEDSLENRAREWVRQTFQKPGKAFLQAVHRIDKPVSGVVLFARTSKALSRLTQAVRERQCQKIYYAIVESPFPDVEGTFEDYLVHDEYRARVTCQQEQGAKLSLLHYRLLETYQKMKLLEIVLETGRYHQIRVQFASRGYPLIGDAKYGSKKAYFPAAIALHHRQLTIPHPVKADPLDILAPLPSYWHGIP
jgi:23S rRNA pseudouridine1911/1915/1917 synthase